MTSQSDFRRYLTNVDTISTQQLFTDCLIIGGGIAGLRAAIEAADHCPVTLICKSTIDNSNTYHAQGGIASVLNSDDNFASHISDTLQTGCGLCDETIVNQVITEGPALIKQLIDWGADFDINADGNIATTLEGGHSSPRVAHAHGDKTGKVVAEFLIDKARQCKNIHIIENFFAIDLLTDAGRCRGVVGLHNNDSQIIWSTNTILATGGAGRLYRETTNPQGATADGLAMAYRAGATLIDMEFMQFHPTTLYIAGASRALITEALRGEGAILVDNKGEAFMTDYHPKAELAPRDIVSRAILSHMHKTNATHVYLDVRHFDKAHFAKRFPTISQLCDDFDIDISTDLIPVRPSAHYMIGGVGTDSKGLTNIANLYACGEVSATGLHGANRLASNSLLEGLVFGVIVGRCASSNMAELRKNLKNHFIKYTIPKSERSRLDTSDVTNSLGALMWRNVGITRKKRGLDEACEIIRFWQRYVMDKTFGSFDGFECQNMLTVCLLMAESAAKRKESRGVHFRQDYPKSLDEFQNHLAINI